MYETSDSDVLQMFNSQWGYVTCDDALRAIMLGAQCVDFTRCKLFLDDFTFGC